MYTYKVSQKSPYTQQNRFQNHWYQVYIIYIFLIAFKYSFDRRKPWCPKYSTLGHLKEHLWRTATSTTPDVLKQFIMSMTDVCLYRTDNHIEYVLSIKLQFCISPMYGDFWDLPMNLFCFSSVDTMKTIVYWSSYCGCMSNRNTAIPLWKKKIVILVMQYTALVWGNRESTVVK